MVKCKECKNLRDHGKITSPSWEPKKEVIPIYICMIWPSPIDNPIMSKIEIEAPRKCEFYERAS
jgi:hypothetical protein